MKPTADSTKKGTGTGSSRRKTNSPQRKTKKKRRLAQFALADQLQELERSLASTDVLAWPQIGVSVDQFPLLSEHLDGFRNSLYVLAGATRMGKTAFALELLVSLLQNDPTARGIFVTLEQPARDLNIRLVGQCGEVNMEYLLNPTREGAATYESRKMAGLDEAKQLSSRLSIIDESQGALRFEDIHAFVDEGRQKFSGPLFLVIDPLFKLRVGTQLDHDPSALMATLTRELKTLTISHQVGVIVTTGVTGAAGQRRPHLVDLEAQAGLLYDAQVIMLLYCDYFNNAETTFLEWEWGTDDLMVPIFELNVAKNKMGSFSGRLYYRFYNSFSKFKECARLEMENYDKMLYNLRVNDQADPLIDDQIIGRFENLDR